MKKKTISILMAALLTMTATLTGCGNTDNSENSVSDETQKEQTTTEEPAAPAYELLDSLNKRINFLNEVIAALELTGVETIHGRAEDFAKPGKCREKYDLCVSRAVANLSTLSEYCLPFVKVGGKFISYKSEKITEEMNAAQHAVKILGGKMDGQVEFTLPDSDIYRNLFIITKQKSTPAKYPRKAGLPSKEPLS